MTIRRPGKYVSPYLEKLKISRGPRKPGEVFAIKLKGVGFVYGRVIRDGCGDAPSPGNPPKDLGR